MANDGRFDILTDHVSSVTANIYAITDLNGIVGAALARVSRAKGGVRDTLAKEFIGKSQGLDAKTEKLLRRVLDVFARTAAKKLAVDDVAEFKSALEASLRETCVLDPVHAEALLMRILIAFGDDSVGELEGAHVVLEDITMLASKEIEDRRLASYIEQSTRYVFYDMPGPDGKYRYYVPDSIKGTPLEQRYVATMDFVFDTYVALIEPMKAYYSSLKPLEEAAYDIDGDGEKERYEELTNEADRKAFRTTYGADMRTKACDTLRFLLPLSTLTNVGVFGNGRFYENVLSYCYSSELPEANRIAAGMHAALNTVIPIYVRRAKRKDYLVATREAMRRFTPSFTAGHGPAATDEVVLADRAGAYLISRLRSSGQLSPEVLEAAMQDVSDEIMLACMLYAYSDLPFAQLRHIVRHKSAEERRSLVDAYVGDRQTRRDRPGRAFEAGYEYTFDCLTDYGTYKDLQRHRMTTLLRQRFSPKFGFVMPEDLVACGFGGRAEECHRRIEALYDAMLAAGHAAEAQYAVMHGHKVRWLMGFNDREAHHLIELRTGAQGHPSYRKVAMKMHDLITARSKWRGDVMKFADHGDYFWARGDSEARQRAKERALEAALQKEKTEA